MKLQIKLSSRHESATGGANQENPMTDNATTNTTPIEIELLRMLATHVNIPVPVLKTLAKSESHEVLSQVAQNPNTPIHVLLNLGDAAGDDEELANLVHDEAAERIEARMKKLNQEFGGLKNYERRLDNQLDERYGFEDDPEI